MVIPNKTGPEEISEKFILPCPGRYREEPNQCLTNLLEHQTSYNSYEPDIESLAFNPPQFFYMKKILIFIVSITLMFAGSLAGYAAYRMRIATNSRSLWVIPYETLGVQPHSEGFNGLQKTTKNNVSMPDDSLVFHEETEMDLSDDETYASVDVPDIKDVRPARFIHDFTGNQTAIYDAISNRCFVMPLDRGTILPPKSFIDFMNKMDNGYYNVNTERIKRTMRVAMPPFSPPIAISERIIEQCRDKNIYILEEYKSGLQKREVNMESSTTYAEYLGKGIVEYNVVNMADIDKCEGQHLKLN
uniref:Integral membrane protein 2 n=1 Tax=Glossina brevipalpis TaxID=37001 RepID=A0A1A9WYR4_9MUSC